VNSICLEIEFKPDFEQSGAELTVHTDDGMIFLEFLSLANTSRRNEVKEREDPLFLPNVSAKWH